LKVLRNLIGVSLPQFLAFIDAFHKDSERQITGTPAAGVSPTGEKTLEDVHAFRKGVWKAFRAHPDVLIGEDKRGNGLDLSDIEALPVPTTEALRPGNPLSETIDLAPPGYEIQIFPEKDRGSRSSLSVQLLGELEHRAAQNLPLHGKSTTSIHDDAEVHPLVTFQEPSLSSGHVNDISDAIAKEPPSSPSSQTNHGPKIGKMVSMTTVHAKHLSETAEMINGESRSHDELIVTPHNLTTQLRIYVSRERIRKAMTYSDGTSNGTGAGLKPLGNTPKRRGRPPNVKTNEFPRRRGRPPKPKSSPLLADSFALPTDKFAGKASPVILNSTPEHNKRLRRQTEKVIDTLEPKMRPVKGASKLSTFTSHDESQRAAGIPGIYFDIAELRMTRIGRPKKRKIALFKSEKLKSLPWMKGFVQDVEMGNIVNQPVVGADFAVLNDSMNLIQEQSTTTRKRSRDSELGVPADEPAPKKSLLDVLRGFGSSRSAPYKSPYLPLSANSYVSPYSLVAPRATTSTSQESLLPDIQAKLSRTVSNQLQTPKATASAVVPQYKSPYAPLHLANPKSCGHSSNSTSHSEQPLSVKASQSTKDYGLEAEIKSAGQLEIPDVTVRLPSSKDGIAGNLCLSRDKKSLTFVAAATQLEIPPVIIKISDISEPPETSEVGSQETTLRITTSSTAGIVETHQFRFLATEDAFRTANNMRAKVVTAMMLLDVKDNTETVKPNRPFKCSGCDGSWKNIEGLKYHQTKSKTHCNPNYTPVKKPSTLAGHDILGLAAAALDMLSGDAATQPHNHSFPGSSADDSAVEQLPTKLPMSTVAGIKSRDARSDAELQRGKEIIIALLDSNELVFPGEKSLWFAFVAASLQKSPDSGLPNYGTCNTALDLLEGTGQVRKLQFSFKDERGLMKTRTLITRQNVDPTSAVVMEMKENIKAVFPEYYIPPGFAPPKVVQSMLEERQSRPQFSVGVRTGQQSSPVLHSHELAAEQIAESAHTPTNYIPSNKVTRSGRISRRPQRLQQSAVESSFQNLDGDIDKEGDDSNAEDFPNHNSISRALNFTADSRRKRKRAAAFITNLYGANPMSRDGANAIHEPKLTPTQYMIEDESHQDTDLDRPQLKRRKNEAQSAESEHNCKAIWQPATTYLQGKNGAWDTSTLPHSTLARKKYTPRTGLPEPVTYMQTLNNSAWSFRPYGHGVRPIHARPSKRAEGQTAYLTRIQHGFRPVMMPNGDIFIPSTPSSDTTEKTSKAAEEGVSKPAGLTRRKRKYAAQPSNILQTGATIVEGISPSSDSITKKRIYTRRRTFFNSKTQAEASPPTKTGQVLETPQNPSIIVRSSNPVPVDGRRATNFPISSGHDPFLNALDQTMPHTAHRQEAELTEFDDKDGDGKAWDPNRRAPIAQYMMTSRRLTALPADLEGIEDSLAGHPDLKVEVAVDHGHGIRRRTKEGAISADTEYRLMIAVVVIRTLTGGLDRQIDWVLVSKIFPDLPMNAISKRWPNLYMKHKQMVERLGTDFQEFFLEAYEKEEINPIDYDHLVDYDWNSLVDLVLERIDINPDETTTQRLPASRDILNQTFAIDFAGNNKAWRDEYFSLAPPLYRRMEHAASEQSTLPISQEPPPNLDIDQFTIAKSWARANTVTPSESYDRDFAVRKLGTIDSGVLSAATSALFESKVLMQRNKGRPIPNRGVEITDTFAASLRKHLDETHLTQAVVFKASLDAKLRSGEVVMVEWAAKDGEILAITNLQAHGRIKLEPKGVPMNKFGLTGGGYQTKKMDKAALHFDLQILPTDSYLYDANIPILAALTPEFWPPRGIAGAIPVWYDIAENLIPAMWKKVVSIVLATIAMRPGAMLKELVRIFTPALEEWEMRILIDWGLRVGALTVLREGYEGWNVAEWWWVIGGWA